MLKRLSRTIAALSFALTAFLPLTASAQYTGTNGQIYFDYNNYEDAYLTQSVAAVNSDGSESHMVAQGTNDGTTNTIKKGATAKADGSKIAYVNVVIGGGTTQYSIVQADPDGTSPAALYTAPGTSNFIIIDNLVYSSDGATLYFTQSNDGATNDGIYTVPSTGGSATKIVTSNPASSDTAKSIAVSASNLYFIRNVITGGGSINTYEIDSADLDGTNQAVLNVIGASSGVGTIHDVAIDDSLILFSKKDGGNMVQLYTVDTATGATVTPLTTFTDSNYMEAAGYSPDGNQIIYSYVTYSPSAYHNGYIVADDGSGTPAQVRADLAGPFWSAVAEAADGTYPTPLVLGQTSAPGGQGGLPEAGRLGATLPIALGVLGLLAAGAIEVGRRVRRRA